MTIQYFLLSNLQNIYLCKNDFPEYLTDEHTSISFLPLLFILYLALWILKWRLLMRSAAS